MPRPNSSRSRDASPSVRTTSSRRFTTSEKKCELFTGTSAWRFVARAPWYCCDGGGRSIPTDCAIVRSKSAGSVVGIASGRTRSVIVAIPTGTSPSARSSRNAIFFARASRVSWCGPEDARIDSDVSMTMNACASPRSRTSCWRTTTGCAAAMATSAGRSTSAAAAWTRGRRPGSRSRSSARTLLERRSVTRSAASGAAAARTNTASTGVRNVTPKSASSISTRCR